MEEPDFQAMVVITDQGWTKDPVGGGESNRGKGEKESSWGRPRVSLKRASSKGALCPSSRPVVHWRGRILRQDSEGQREADL